MAEIFERDPSVVLLTEEYIENAGDLGVSQNLSAVVPDSEYSDYTGENSLRLRDRLFGLRDRITESFPVILTPRRLGVAACAGAALLVASPGLPGGKVAGASPGPHEYIEQPRAIMGSMTSDTESVPITGKRESTVKDAVKSWWAGSSCLQATPFGEELRIMDRMNTPGNRFFFDEWLPAPYGGDTVEQMKNNNWTILLTFPKCVLKSNFEATVDLPFNRDKDEGPQYMRIIQKTGCQGASLDHYRERAEELNPILNHKVTWKTTRVGPLVWQGGILPKNVHTTIHVTFCKPVDLYNPPKGVTIRSLVLGVEPPAPTSGGSGTVTPEGPPVWLRDRFVWSDMQGKGENNPRRLRVYYRTGDDKPPRGQANFCAAGSYSAGQKFAATSGDLCWLGSVRFSS